MKYFAYGSNMSHQQMRERCPESRFLGMAKLDSHRFIFDGYSLTRGGAVGNIIADGDAVVFGGLFEISENDLISLDICEGYVSKMYDRKEFFILQGDVRVEAIVYYRAGEKTGSPSQTYKDIVLLGAEDCGLPRDYIKSVLIKL